MKQIHPRAWAPIHVTGDGRRGFTIPTGEEYSYQQGYFTRHGIKAYAYGKNSDGMWNFHYDSLSDYSLKGYKPFPSERHPEIIQALFEAQISI